MKKIILLLMFMTGLVSGQSITRVDYEVLPGDLLEVTYTLVDTEPNTVYDIALYASLDGGYYFPIRAHSVIGDVGPKVRGAGRKTIRWKVTEDVPSLVSDNLVLKVTGVAKLTMTGVAMSLFTGNRFTKRMSDGFTIFAGRGLAQTQDSEYFTGLIVNSQLNLVENYRLGFRVTRVPFVYRLEIFHRGWDLNFDPIATDRLRFLSAATEAEVDLATKLNYTGFSWGMAYTPLPIFGIFLPQVGGGLSYNYFNIGSLISSKVAIVANPGMFVDIGLQANFFRWLKMNFGLRTDFINPHINFSRSYFELGIHFSSR